MHRRSLFIAASFTALAAATATADAQTTGKYLAPKDQVVAIRAGRLFDARSGMMMNNQVILVRGDRIADVGANVNPITQLVVIAPVQVLLAMVKAALPSSVADGDA